MRRVSVNYSTFEGDTDFPYWGYYGYYAAPPAATAGSDFETKTGAVTFGAPGETTKTVVVAVKGDKSVEEEIKEYFSLNCDGFCRSDLEHQHAVGMIYDDEPHVSVGDGIGEGGKLRYHGHEAYRSHSPRRRRCQ